MFVLCFFFFQAEDGIRDLVRSRGLGDVYKRQIDDHYRLHNANVARAMHQLGAEASTAFELGRDKVAAFIGAPNRDEVVFTKNASEALNLVARAVGDSGRIGQDHEIVITEMEHHSNIVPWQQPSQRTGCLLYTYEDADDLICVHLGGSRTIVKKTMLSHDQYDV